MKKRKRQTADKKRQKKTCPSVAAGGRRAVVLAALLSGKTRRIAAEAAGISTRTLDRITADPTFRAELETSRKGTFAEALQALKDTAARAVETLARLLKSKYVNERRQAAATILTFAMRAHEFGEIEARLLALEKAAAEFTAKPGGGPTT